MAEPRKTIHDGTYQVLVQCLRAARRAADVTQADLAAQLGAEQSYVSKYERAERRVDIVEVRAICRALGMDLLHFIETFESALKRSGLS